MTPRGGNGTSPHDFSFLSLGIIFHIFKFSSFDVLKKYNNIRSVKETANESFLSSVSFYWA